MNLFYNFNKQEYFRAEGLFASQQLAYVLDLLLTLEGPEHRLKNKDGRPEPAVFSRQSFGSGENIFQN